MKNFLKILFLLPLGGANAQFAPQAGQPGSTAIHKDDIRILGWAQSCLVQRGFMNVANPSLGQATTGNDAMATGKAGSNGVVSLGDAGTATLTFASALKNGSGPDFLVFENGFLYAQDSNLAYMEIAFVEVSSDGINFHRFPASSFTDSSQQTDPYGTLDASKINNLAGKYVFPYGTPFDLEELKNEPGLDVDHITHIRIVDVVGSVQPAYASRDKDGRRINDPWPTDFASGGFDLDAVGVINRQEPNGLADLSASGFSIFPNPLASGSSLKINTSFPEQALQVQIYSLNGQLMYEAAFAKGANAVINPVLKKGIYIIRIEQEGSTGHTKLFVHE